MIKFDYNIHIEGDEDDGYDAWVGDELVAERMTLIEAEEKVRFKIREIREDAQLRAKRAITTFDVDVETFDDWRTIARKLGINNYSFDEIDQQFMTASTRHTLTCKIDRLTGDVFVTAFNGVMLVHPAKISKEKNDEA